MVFLKCSSDNKWGKRHVFLSMVFFTLIFLILSSISRLPLKLVGSHTQILYRFPLRLRNFQKEASETEPTLRNSSWTTTTPPESTKKQQKLSHVYNYIINQPDKCKDGPPYLILLILAERWQKEARQAVRQTWGKEDLLPGVKILRLFFLGKDIKWTDDAKQSLLEESRVYHDIIQQDYLDTYNNLSTKVLMGLNWVNTHCPGASYIMKTDSDMFINTEYLINSLLKPDQPPKLNYFTGALFINARPIRNTNSKWYMSPQEYPENEYPLFCSGTGYVFSAGLASRIVEVSPGVRWIHLEDVYVGLCLEKLGVKPMAPPKGSDFNIWRIPYTDCGYNQIVTSHGFSPGEMVSTWNQLQRNKHTCVSGNVQKPSK